ncbi:hypothetical protein C6366_03065 [Desulfonatronum sp. SC1]|nr:hypothetical protein C6366_03065 [Desulfonatronum sp. SC1]
MGDLLKRLEQRGWLLGNDADGLNLAQRIERLLGRILAGCPADRHVGLKPLPDWLVNTFRDDGDKHGGSEPLKSYLNHSEAWHDILDSMVLWLNYDQLQAASLEIDRVFFDQQRSVLRKNMFYSYLAEKEYVFWEENPVFQKGSDCMAMPLRHRLAMAGTFCLENFGTNAHREACFELLQDNKKTSRIPDAFLRLHEEACTDPLKTHVVVVSGDTTLFFSLHDFFHDPRKAAWQDGFPCLENNSVQELIEFFRATFIKGNAASFPASHFRHEKLMQPGFVKSLAMIYWRNKLRDHLAQKERNPRNRPPVQRLADEDQAGGQPRTYHSRLILEKIPLNAKVSLEFAPESGPSAPGFVCRMGGLKDRYLLLIVPSSEQARCEAATRETLIFRFSIPHKHQDQRFYACTCSLRHVKPVSTNTTALVVEPIQDVFPLDRKHPRVAADLLPMQSAHIHLGLAGLPENVETLAESGEPVALYSGISSSTWLEDISAGGACLTVNSISVRETVMAVYASGCSPSGVLHFRRTSSKRNSSDVLLSFRLVSLRQGEDALRAGLQFQAEAVRSKSGKLSWWPIQDLGCHELSRIIFAALLRRRDAF